MSKIVITSPMRAGSTLVFDSLVRALETKDHQFVNREKDLIEKDIRLTKTHSLHSLNFARFQASNPNAKVVVCLRQWKDLLISRLLYCRKITGKKETKQEIRNRIEEWEKLEDVDFVQRFIDSEPVTVKELLREAKRFWELKNFHSPNLHVARYEDFLFDPKSFLTSLLEHLDVSLDSKKLNTILRLASPHHCGETKPANFASRMTSGHWHQWLTEEQSSRIDSIWHSI